MEIASRVSFKEKPIGKMGGKGGIVNWGGPESYEESAKRQKLNLEIRIKNARERLKMVSDDFEKSGELDEPFGNAVTALEMVRRLAVHGELWPFTPSIWIILKDPANESRFDDVLLKERKIADIGGMNDITKGRIASLTPKEVIRTFKSVIEVVKPGERPQKAFLHFYL